MYLKVSELITTAKSFDFSAAFSALLSKNDQDADISSTSFLATQSTHAIVSKIRQQQFMAKFSRT